VAAAGGSVDAVGGSAVGYCAWVLVPGRVLAGDDGMALELPPVTCGLPCRGRYCGAHEDPAREAEEELRRAFVAGGEAGQPPPVFRANPGLGATRRGLS
jgi:hypothetical protein